MLDKPTGVQTNQGHASTDDYITRTYVLPLLTDEATRGRLIAEHKANPIGRPPQMADHPSIIVRTCKQFSINSVGHP
jgi:hypothetical protein